MSDNPEPEDEEPTQEEPEPDPHLLSTEQVNPAAGLLLPRGPVPKGRLPKGRPRGKR